MRAQVLAEGTALFIPPVSRCDAALPNPSVAAVLILPAGGVSFPRQTVGGVPAIWHFAACRKRSVADDDAAAGLQETGVVVMGAALFMSRWQQVGPAAVLS